MGFWQFATWKRWCMAFWTCYIFGELWRPWSWKLAWLIFNKKEKEMQFVGKTVPHKKIPKKPHPENTQNLNPNKSW